MPGYEARAIPSLRYWIEHEDWPRLRLVREVGKYEVDGGGAHPPLNNALARGERGTYNHGDQAAVMAVLAGVKGSRVWLRGRYRFERENGHCWNELLSASHCDERYASQAAIAIEARRQRKLRPLREDSLEWWAREVAVDKRLWVPTIVRGPRRRGSGVGPCSRGWGGKAGKMAGGEPSSEQHSNIRDEGVIGWGVYGRKPLGAYTHADADVMALLQHSDMPWPEILDRASQVRVEQVRVIAPIFEHVYPSGLTVRWWHPPAEVWRTRPTVYTAWFEGSGDWYDCNAGSQPDIRGAVQIGRAA